MLTSARRWKIVAVLLISALLLTAESAEIEPLHFEDDRPLTISWEDVAPDGEGAANEICNVGSEPVQPRARLTGFKFRQSGADVDVDSVLRVELEEPGILGPGDCRSLLIFAVPLTDSNPLDPGTYTGLLVVTGTDAFARREISIDGASTGDSLRFADDGNLQVNWSDVADDGVEVFICNDSSSNTVATSSQLSDFGFRKLDGTAATESSILTVAIDEPGAIAPIAEGEECPASLTIRAAEGLGPDNPLLPGEYSGLLIVTSGEFSTSRPVSIAGAQSYLYDGVVGKIELRGTFRGPFNHEVKLTSGTVTLSYDEDVGAPDRVPTSGVLLGQVVGGGEVGRVRMVSAGDAANGQQTFTVGVWGIRDQGEFAGPLAFDQFGGTADMTLTVRDHLSWLLAVLLFGVFVAFVGRVFERRVLRRASLWRERIRIAEAYDKARVAFGAEPGWGGMYTPPTAVNVKVFLAGIKNATKSYAKRSFVFDALSEAYKNIAKSLRAARDDATLLSARDPMPVDQSDTWKTGFAAKLQALEDQLEAFDAWLQKHVPGRASPNFVYSAAGLLRPPTADRQLTVGGALKRAEELQRFIGLIDKWKKLYQEVGVFAQWALRLVRRIDPPDQPLWDKATVRIDEVMNELFGARNADELDAVGVADDLKRTYALLANLGAKYDVSRPDWEDVQPAVILALDSVFERNQMWSTIRTEDETTLAVNERTASTIPQLNNWLAHGTPTDVSEMAEVVVGGTKLLIGVGEFVAILVGFTGGSAVAIAALYTNTFGSFANYAAVFAVGFGSEVLVNGLMQAIQQRRDALGPAPAA